MTSQTSQAVTKRSADGELMPPPPPPKKIKRPPVVLEEDIYTDALSQIIARDYFPGLLEVQSKQEFLNALESKDKEWIASAGKRLKEVMTPGAQARTGTSMASSVPDTPKTACGGDTPRSISSISQPTSQGEAGPDVSGLSLGAFQAKYTSEDNESFNKLLDKQNAKRREKYAWLWNGNKILSARQIAHRQREAKRLAEQGRQQTTDKQLMLATDMDARPAKPDAWKSGPENNLMFIPSSIEDTHETQQQKAEAESRAGPKQVLHHNTRFPAEQPQMDEHEVPPSPSVSAIKDAIAGRPRLSESEAGFSGAETPRVNGYTFVDEDEPEEEDTSDLMKKLLSSADTGPNPFTIKENRRREELHHRLVDKISRRKRSEAAASSFTPVTRTPGTPWSKGKPMTPAAQRLLEKVGRTPRTSSPKISADMWTPWRRGK
ncbi:hypothetical protein VTN49DRAFT_1484 [Thermomyces lanuginosus]|uniref:uncharacterized protein n=1 Tax=Thermomyces lanuginosus TaxID=5541 RepID=UPI0037422A51